MSKNWYVFSNCDLHSLCSNRKLHIIGMQFHHEQLQDVLPNLLLQDFPHLLFEMDLFEDDDHSWRRMEFVLLTNVLYYYK